MLAIISALHILTAVLMIFFILLQDSKGGAMGALTGGGSNTVFGSTGATNFLVKITRALAIVFAITSISLAYITSSSSSSVLDTNMPQPTPSSLQQETNKAEESKTQAPAESTPPAESQDSK